MSIYMSVDAPIVLKTSTVFPREQGGECLSARPKIGIIIDAWMFGVSSVHKSCGMCLCPLTPVAPARLLIGCAGST